MMHIPFPLQPECLLGTQGEISHQAWLVDEFMKPGVEMMPAASELYLMYASTHPLPSFTFTMVGYFVYAATTLSLLSFVRADLRTDLSGKGFTVVFPGDSGFAPGSQAC